MEVKVCRYCGVSKPPEQMVTKGISKRTGEKLIRNVCRTCDNRRLQKQRKIRISVGRRERLNKHRRRCWLYNKYGIDQADLEKLKNDQGGRCLICRKVPKVLVIDHNNETGNIRGLLCSNCNTAIGLLQEDIVILARAMEYIQRRGNQKIIYETILKNTLRGT